MLYEHKSFGEIALALGRSKSTISREIQRNASPEYQLYLSHRAHGRSEARRKQNGSRPRLKNKQIVSFVEAKLKEGWSPEQIAGRLPKEPPRHSISHEAIYQYIYHPKTPSRLQMIGYLRRAHRKRKAKGIGRKARQTKIPNRISIDQRPKAVEARKRIGHWEGDTWTDPEGKEVRSISIVTTAANGVLKPIHDRMPVILREADESLWLDPEAKADQLIQLIGPYSDEEMDVYPVSSIVNSARYETADCIVPFAEKIPAPSPSAKTYVLKNPSEPPDYSRSSLTPG